MVQAARHGSASPARRREDPVDHDGVDGVPVQRQRGEHPAALGDDDPLGGQHDAHAGPGGGEQRADADHELAPGPQHEQHLGAGHRHTGRRRRRGPQHGEQPALGREQPVEVPAEHLGQREQAQGLGGGGAVDDDQVPVAAVGLVGERGEGGDLLGAGQRGELVGDDRVDTHRVEHPEQVVAHDLPVGLDGGVRADRERVQAGLDLGGLAPGARGGEVDVEGVAEAVCRVGRHDQRPQARAGGPDRGGGGGRRLADAALAGHEDDACHGGGQPSARFLSSVRARLMMCFSALRFSRPIIGMVSSTSRS